MGKGWGFKGPDLHMPDIDIHLPKFGGKGKVKGDIEGPDVDLNVSGPDVDVDLKGPEVDVDIKKPDVDLDLELKAKKPDLDIDGGAKVGVDLEVKSPKTPTGDASIKGPKKSWSFNP